MSVAGEGRPPLTATYRLQLNSDFPFAAAQRVLPYLARLGVSHVYLSPVLAARPGSRHGYDVADPRLANPELGGDAGFEALARDAHAHGLGVLVDIVPNHMGIGPANPFWMDTLRHGRASPFAKAFDVDWDAAGREGVVVIPVLGNELADVVASGELRLERRDDDVRAVYYEHEWPIDPRTLPSDVDVEQLRGDALTALLARQHWRAVHWRRGPRELNYRRFFDVGELAAVRVDDPAVFDLVHAWTLDRVRDGLIDGLRVDHVDGLRDPLAYLRRLRAELDARRPGERVPLFVEKILHRDERLRDAWPVDGTTGYEALNAIESLFVDAAGMTTIDAAYRRLLRVRAGRGGFEEVAVRGKEHVTRRAFDADVRRLVRQLARAAAGVAPRLSRTTLYEAVVQLAAELPVYRTYVAPTGDATRPLAASAEDFRWIGDAAARAFGHGAADRHALQFVADVLRGEWPGPDASPAAREAAAAFALGFQQTSGAATAKGVEDTAFYRWFPLASLCEVGGDPARPLGTAVDDFHAANVERQTRHPLQLTPADTHDTKRGADVRARLDALSEIPRDWAALVARWRRRHAALHGRVGARSAPDANAEYLVYQTLVGVWPVGGVTNGAEANALCERVVEYMRKATREAKAQTSWTDRDEQYERALDAFVAALVTGGEGAPFRDELTALVDRVGGAARWTALSRTVLQLSGSGTPDVYQASELSSLVLVDPDNRRAVDFDRRRALLDALDTLDAAPDADADAETLRLHVTRTLLRVRRDDPALVRDGAYVPLDVRGPLAPHVVAFARVLDGRGLVVAVPRLALRLAPDGAPPTGAERWRDTRIALPASAVGATARDVLTGEPQRLETELDIAAAFADRPVAVYRWDAASPPRSFRPRRRRR